MFGDLFGFKHLNWFFFFFGLQDNGMAVGMMGSGFVGQEQVWSFMPAYRHNM
jgi:hypothetical protein